MYALYDGAQHQLVRQPTTLAVEAERAYGATAAAPQASTTIPSIVSGGPTALVSEAAAWIDPGDGAFLAMCKAVYSRPLPQLIEGGWSLMPEYTQERLAVWKLGETYAVAARGTQDVGDVVDDITLAFGTNDTLLGREMSTLCGKILELRNVPASIVLTGHSLGGWAAVQTALAYPGTRTCTFNGAAPPTNPLTTTTSSGGHAYHIGGDVVSAHVRGATRVNKGYSFLAATSECHSLDRFYARDPVPLLGMLSADEEQLLWLLAGADLGNGTLGRAGGRDTSSLVTAATAIPSPVANVHQFAAGEFVAATPIPGSVMEGNYGFWSGYLERAGVGYYFLVKTGMSGIVEPLDRFAATYAGLAGMGPESFAAEIRARGPGLFPASGWESGFMQANATVKGVETLGIAAPGSGLIAPVISGIAGLLAGE